MIFYSILFVLYSQFQKLRSEIVAACGDWSSLNAKCVAKLAAMNTEIGSFDGTTIINIFISFSGLLRTYRGRCIYFISFWLINLFYSSVYLQFITSMTSAAKMSAAASWGRPSTPSKRWVTVDNTAGLSYLWGTLLNRFCCPSQHLEIVLLLILKWDLNTSILFDFLN